MRPDLAIPNWFWEVYDAIIMSKDIHPAPTARQIPLYLRWRYRTVIEAAKWANLERAKRSKAMGVYDFAKY